MAQIIPTTDPAFNLRAQAFNAALPSVVAHRVALGQHVHLVDMYDVVTIPELADSMHPTPLGYAKMADAWFDAIAAVLPPGTATSADGGTGDRVSVFDLNLIGAHWGQPGPIADFNSDGSVNIFDINYLVEGAPNAASPSPVPEPAAWLLGAMAAAALICALLRSG